jgi:hypothetical protein
LIGGRKELKWSWAGRGIGTDPELRKQEVVWKNKHILN